MKKGTEKELHQWEKLRRNKGESDDTSWRNIWDASDQYGRDFEPDVEAGLRRLKHKLATDEPATAKVVQFSSAKWLRTIAAVGVLLLLAWAGISLLGNETNTAKWVEIQTTEDEKRELVLPDGSSITLNENSYIAYQSDLNEADTRQVRLRGEAYFDVERRPEQAFEIATDRAEISVLGTSFNVRAFAEETSTEVEVTSGRVAVRSVLKNEEVVLEAKEAVVLNDDKLQEQAAPLLNRQAWRTGQITFRQTPVAEALFVLARFYEVDFDLDASKLTNCTLTGNWENAPLEDAIAVIESLTPLQIKEIAKGFYQVNGQCD